jgi:tetratricopeptide (TPR) repeat protein
MRPLQTLACASSLAAALLSGNVAASAPSAAEKATAEALFEEGAALVEKGEFAPACEKLAASQELDPALGTLLRLADCYDRLGKTASAWASFKQAAAMARTSAQADREAMAAERAADLEARLSRLTVVVTNQSAGDSLRVRLDGVEVPRASWGSALPVDPGSRRLEVDAPGYEPWSQQLAIAAGPATQKVEVPPLVSAPEAAAPPAGETPSALAASEQERPGGTQRTFAYVLGGVGLAALATGGVFGYLAYDKNEQSLDRCLKEDPNACSQEGARLREDAQSRAQIANIAAGAGAGLLATGLVLLLTAPSGRSESGRVLPALDARLTSDRVEFDFRGEF